MTDDIREKAIEAAARAAMKADGCGLTIEGEHVFCDDPRADHEIGRKVCLCKNGARAAIDAYERAMWRPVSECPPDKFIQYLVSRDDAPPVRASRDGYGGPFRMHHGGVMETTNEPTHFRPLPLPPEDKA